MKRKLLLPFAIVLMGMYSCGKGDTNSTPGTQTDREGDRANAIGTQRTDLNDESEDRNEAGDSTKSATDSSSH